MSRLCEKDVRVTLEPRDSDAFLDALPAGSTAVVCHHSFTIPGILRNLGLSDDEVKEVDVSTKFNNFAVVQRRKGAPPQLVQLTYGAP